MMAKWSLVFFAVACVMAATAAGRELPQPYQVTGKVYCDTCQCGFETNVTKYIPGATVELQCMDKSDKVIFSTTTTTKGDGSFKFVVNQDHGEQVCDVVLVKSPWNNCKIVDKGRGRSRVIVTNSNGIVSYHRYANNLGFFQDHALPVCSRLLQYYLYSE